MNQVRGGSHADPEGRPVQDRPLPAGQGGGPQNPSQPFENRHSFNGVGGGQVRQREGGAGCGELRSERQTPKRRRGADRVTGSPPAARSGGRRRHDALYPRGQTGGRPAAALPGGGQGRQARPGRARRTRGRLPGPGGLVLVQALGHQPRQGRDYRKGRGKGQGMARRLAEGQVYRCGGESRPSVGILARGQGSHVGDRVSAQRRAGALPMAGRRAGTGRPG